MIQSLNVLDELVFSRFYFVSGERIHMQMKLLLETLYQSWKAGL